jgi:uncharacterized membrane protein
LTHERQKTEREGKTLQETVQGILWDKKPETVTELFSLVQKHDPDVSREDLAETLRKIKDEDKIILEMPPPSVKSFREYIMLREWNAWYAYVVLVCTLTLIAIYLIPSIYPYVALRWVAGSIFVLFIPGYVTVQALFPRGRDLDEIERVALSVGLSLAITPLIGLLLNYLPWGIRLDPIVASLSLYSLAIGLVGSWRRYHSVTPQHTQVSLS